MEQASNMEMQSGPRTFAGGYLFGVPVGGLGWFASLLMSAASGFGAFFIGTFLGIFGISIFNGVTHRGVDLSWSYKGFGLGLGILVLMLAASYLGMLWIKRTFRRA